MSNQDEFKRLSELLAGFIVDDNSIGEFNGRVNRVGITKAMYNPILKLLEEEVAKRNEKWIKRVQEKLSDRLPKDQLHKRRKDRSRLFPYFVTGELYDSMVYDLQAYKEKHYTYDVTSFIQFTSLHAILTDKGIARGGKSDAAWVGWLDDILHSRNKYRGGIPSYNKWMSELFKQKRLKNKINTLLKAGIVKQDYTQGTLF